MRNRFKILNSETTSIKRAALINAISKYLTVLLNLLFTAVLARLLSPSEYGIVAVITVFTNFFILFSDSGISAAVIQNKDLTSIDENRIFTFSLYLGIVLGLVFYGFSFLLDQIYDTDVYHKIGVFLSVSLAFRAFNMVPNAKLMKSKRFMQSALRNVVTNITGYLTAIVIAALGGSYYALVAQSLIVAVLIFLWNLLCSDLQIERRQVFKSVRMIADFSAYLFGSGIFSYFSRNMDNLLVGLVFGDTQLGFYDKAYTLMKYPVDTMINVINPSLHPILSDHQNNSSYILKQYLKLAKFLSLAAVYISCICFFSSREIVLLFFGSQWEGSVLAFRYLSISLLFQIIGFLTGSMHLSLNHPKALLFSDIAGAVIIVSGIGAGIILGSIQTVALCYSIASMLNFLKSQWFLSRFCFSTNMKNLLNNYLPEIMILVAMTMSLIFIPAFDNLLLSLTVKSLIGTGIYLAMLLITKEHHVLLSILPHRMRKKLPAWLLR